MIGQLDEAAINNLLSCQAIGRLACCFKNRPYIAPITFSFDGKYLYGQTNFGKKLRAMRKNPNVCVEIDIVTDMRNWQYVVVYGVFKELKKEEAEEARKIFLSSVYPLETKSTVHSFEHTVNYNVDDSTRIKSTMYKIKIKKIIGRFEKQ